MCYQRCSMLHETCGGLCMYILLAQATAVCACMFLFRHPLEETSSGRGLAATFFPDPVYWVTLTQAVSSSHMLQSGLNWCGHGCTGLACPGWQRQCNCKLVELLTCSSLVGAFPWDVVFVIVDHTIGGPLGRWPLARPIMWEKFVPWHPRGPVYT
jgi:hypothetical protein